MVQTPKLSVSDDETDLVHGVPRGPRRDHDRLGVGAPAQILSRAKLLISI